MRTVARRFAAPSIGLAFAAAVGGCGANPEADPARAAGDPASTAPAAYIVDIEAATVANEDYRRVLFTGPHMQLVLMSLRPGEEIGSETHDDGDQFVRVEAGVGSAVLDGRTHALADGTALVIPAGVEHNVVNTGTAPLRLYVLYTPPEHPDGTRHPTRRDAEAAGAHD